MLERLVGIPGDISKEELGLSKEDEQTLIENVSVVIHLAATIQFSVSLRESLTLNLLGTRRVMMLCKKMKKLDVRKSYYITKINHYLLFVFYLLLAVIRACLHRILQLPS